MYSTDTTQDSTRTFSRLRITDLDALPERDVQIFDPGILAEGYSHQIVAPYESGKTFLSLICANEFLKRGLRVLYLDYENRKSSIKERFDLIDTNNSDRNNLLYVNQPDLDLGGDSKEQWVGFLKYHEPNLIIFDSQNGFLSNAGRDENSSTGFQEWANVYLKIPRAMEMTTLVIDHTGWEGTHSRGTSRKPDEFDIVWNVTVKKEFSRSVIGELQLRAKKDRDSVIPKNCLNFVIGGTPFQYEVAGAPDSDDDLSKDEQKTYDLVAKNSRNDVGTRRKEINQLFNSSKSRADKTIQALLKGHLIYQDQESKLYWTLDSILDSPSNFESSNQDSHLNPSEGSSDSEEGVEGEGVPGSRSFRTGPQDPPPLPKEGIPREENNSEDNKQENLTLDPKAEEVSNEDESTEDNDAVDATNIMNRIDTLDYSPRGIEVLKTVAIVFIENPMLMIPPLPGSEQQEINRALSLAEQEGVKISKGDLSKALRVLEDNFRFTEIVREEIRKIFSDPTPINPDSSDGW